MKYLFNEWSVWEKKIIEKFLLLYLDFDGTLVPIKKDPDQVRLPPEVKQLLRSLAQQDNLELAVISGRGLHDLEKRVGLKEVIYVGNHGIELKGPQIKFESTLPFDYKKTLARIKKELKARLSSINGVLIEDKGLSLSIHYRRVSKKYIAQVKTIIHEITIVDAIKDKIRKHCGKMVLEIRPPIPWDKGKIILWLLGRQKVLLRNGEVLPIYLGDDKTDEDAFMMIRPRGLSIFVGSSSQSSAARYYLKNPGDVIKFLTRILEIRKESQDARTH